jgi:hypothetical protein
MSVRTLNASVSSGVGRNKGNTFAVEGPAVTEECVPVEAVGSHEGSADGVDSAFVANGCKEMSVLGVVEKPQAMVRLGSGSAMVEDVQNMENAVGERAWQYSARIETEVKMYLVGGEPKAEQLCKRSLGQEKSR